jgi:hypothetical protein
MRQFQICRAQRIGGGAFGGRLSVMISISFAASPLNLHYDLNVGTKHREHQLDRPQKRIELDQTLILEGIVTNCITGVFHSWMRISARFGSQQ